MFRLNSRQSCSLSLFHYSRYKWSVFVEEKAHAPSADYRARRAFLLGIEQERVSKSLMQLGSG